MTLIAKADSGASKTYFRPIDKKFLTNITAYKGRSVVLPDAKLLLLTKQGLINISKHVSKEAQKATVLNNLKSASLISLGHIYDNDCTIVMESTTLYASKTKNTKIKINEEDKIMKGDCNTSDGLYDIPLTKDFIYKNYVIYS